MKKVKIVIASLLILLLFSLPAAADPRGGLFLGFGAGLLNGYSAVPGPVYVEPLQMAQVYPGNSPAPPAGQTSLPAEVPPPPPPSTPGYSGTATAPAPGNQAKCREWRMIERRMEYKFDQSTGKYREAPFEKWDWVDVPCGPNSNPAPPSAVAPPPSAPPEYAFPAPPQVAVIPGTYAYVVPDIDVDILFYHGYWYRPYGGRWYWAQSYNGPWVYLAPSSVPRVLLELPPGYRRIPPGYHRIPYGELHANWGRWERERYWHGDRAWREGWRRP